jgi:mannan endo-1,4-beta-mannosidase
MQRSVALLVFLSALTIASKNSAAQSSQPYAGPINPDATPAARALLREIDGFSGHAILSGQHNFPNSVSRYSDRVYDLTGKYPALFGQDLGFSSDAEKDLALGRASLVEEVIRQYRAGAVIALTWHAVRPTDEEPVTFHDSVQNHLTDWEWKQILTPGTDLYNRWCRQVDLIAGYLREIQDAGVPVLFRPYHEMNGDWFWWGGRPGPHGSAALYRQLYDRFVNIHHLNNLIWVWNVNSPNDHAAPIEAYYPGPAYADLVTMDVYGTFEQRFYDSMVTLAGPARPIALAEVGTMPTLDVFSRQPLWTYFMVWSGFEESANTPEQLMTMYHARNIITRGEPRLPRPQTTPTETPLPVTQNATPTARAVLASLYKARDTGILNGQQLTSDSAQPGINSEPANLTPSATDRRPALVEFTLNRPDASPVLSVVHNAAKTDQIVVIRWTPPRPTDGAFAGTLTDFEWQQLMQPGSDLNSRWAAQVDAVAVTFKQLQQEHIAILWSPYPEPNNQARWWSGRTGHAGSAALLRMLYQRLTQQDEVHNLLWVWEPASPGLPGNGRLSDFYPGPLYCDAFTLDVETLSSTRTHLDHMLKSFAGGKPIGVRVASRISTPYALDIQTDWQWILLPPADFTASH